MPEEGAATVSKWRRKMERLEDEDRTAKRDMKKVIAAAMRDPSTKRNITNELVEARKGPKAVNREGYGDDGDIITGINEDRPWERD